MGNGAAAKKIALTALERLDRLEQTVGQLFSAVGQTFSQVETRFHTTEETLAAVVGLVGVPQVEQAIKDARRDAELAQEAAAKASLAEALAKGNIVKADVVGARSVVIGTELTAEGKPIGHVEGRVQLFIDRIIPDVREKLLGQAAGFEIETPQKGKFIVNEIYDIVEKPEPTNDDAAVEAEVAEAVKAEEEESEASQQS